MKKIGSAIRVISPFCCVLLSCMTFLSLVAQAEPAANVHDAAVQAIESNPEVQASWHALKAASHQVGEVRAGYLP